MGNPTTAIPVKTNSIKVLFWVAPITEMAWPLQKRPWVTHFLPRLQNAFRKIGYDIDSTIIVSEDIVAECGRLGINVDGRFVGIPQGELLGNFRFNALNETIRYQENREYSPFFANLGTVVKKTLGNDYLPDVVISFSTSPFFHKIYPSALLLYHEYGMFSRAPYPETFYLDPCGMTSRNFPAVHAAQINAIPAAKPFIDELGKYRAAICESLCSNELLDAYFKGIRRCFRKMLLLPMGYEGFADARVNFPYQTQFEFVEHVLANTPKDVAVILTQHPHVRAFSDETISSLKMLNGNLFHEPWYSNVSCFSQIAIPYCDACITQSSSLGYQAIFHNKLFFSVGGFCEGIADAHSVQEIPAALEQSPITRDNFLVWMLRNHIADVEDLPDYLQGLLTAWRESQRQTYKPDDWPDSCSIDEFRQRIDRWTGKISPPKLNGATMRVYFDLGKGFSENCKTTWSITEGPQSFQVEREIPLPTNCIAIRFDPTEDNFVEVSDLHLTGNGSEIPLTRHNGSIKNGIISFKTLDPQLVFKLIGNASSVLLKASVRKTDTNDTIRTLTRELSNLQRRMADAARKLAESDARFNHIDDFVHQIRQAIDAEMHQKLLAKAKECGKLDATLRFERAQNERLEGCLSTAQAENERLAREISEERTEKAHLADELHAERMGNEQLKSDLAAVCTEKTRLNAQLVEEQKARAIAEQDLAIARKMRERLSSLFIDCRRQLRECKWRCPSQRIRHGIAWILPYGIVTTWKIRTFGKVRGWSSSHQSTCYIGAILPYGVIRHLIRRNRRRPMSAR